MNARRLSVLTCAVALLLCSCASRADLEKAQADADAAKKEAAQARAAVDELKAQLAKEKGDTEEAKLAAERAEAKARVDTAAAKEKRAKAEAELVKRWNAVAQGMSADLPAPFGTVTFVWKNVDDFPHPTFKGGSAEAYGGFANVLTAFLQQGDNLDFLIDSGLLTAELRTGVAGGSGKGTGWSFANFVNQFSAPNAHGNHDGDTRKALKTISDRIQPIVKRQESRKT